MFKSYGNTIVSILVDLSANLCVHVQLLVIRFRLGQDVDEAVLVEKGDSGFCFYISKSFYRFLGYNLDRKITWGPERAKSIEFTLL